jgi:hypothetical protein
MLFKNNREKDLLDIMKNFFLEKYRFDKDISNVYEIKSSISIGENY